MQFNCSHDEIVEVNRLEPHPHNPNKHTQEQIERLAKIINYQGQRSPIIVWKQTNQVVVGHGRLEAMKHLGWDKVAVDWQEFEDYEQMYSHMTADNAIGEWSALDLKDINNMFTDFGPEFDVDLLGLKDFHVEPLDKIEAPKLDDLDDDEEDDEIECPNCGERFKK